jgi:hypothetical protein
MADFLRVGEESHGIIEALGHAVPAYIETATGYPAELTETEPSETVKQLARFLIALWFNPDGADSDRLRKVIDAFLLVVKVSVSDV